MTTFAYSLLRRTWNRPARWAGALTAAMWLVLAGYGSASSSASASSGAKSTSVAAARGPGSASAFCKTARRYWQERLVVARGEKNMPGNTGQEGTPSLQAQLRAARAIEAALPRLQSTAPANLRAGVRTIVAGEKPYFDALVKANGDQSKLPPTDMARSMSALNSPQAKPVTGYWTQTCGIQLGRAASHP